MELQATIDNILGKLEENQLKRAGTVDLIAERIANIGLLNEQSEAIEASRTTNIQELQNLKNDLDACVNVELECAQALKAIREFTPVKPAPAEPVDPPAESTEPDAGE